MKIRFLINFLNIKSSTTQRTIITKAFNLFWMNLVTHSFATIGISIRKCMRTIVKVVSFSDWNSNTYYDSKTKTNLVFKKNQKKQSSLNSFRKLSFFFFANFSHHKSYNFINILERLSKSKDFQFQLLKTYKYIKTSLYLLIKINKMSLRASVSLNL